jgi:hypothetical protein
LGWDVQEVFFFWKIGKPKNLKKKQNAIEVRKRDKTQKNLEKGKTVMYIVKTIHRCFATVLSFSDELCTYPSSIHLGLSSTCLE